MSREMTISEAIANLNHIYGMVSPNIQRSLDVAFKALEERPQGDWINRKHYQVDEDGYDTMTCNKCGKEIDLPRMEDYYFCPICGAKMKQGES